MRYQERQILKKGAEHPFSDLADWRFIMEYQRVNKDDQVVHGITRSHKSQVMLAENSPSGQSEPENKSSLPKGKKWANKNLFTLFQNPHVQTCTNHVQLRTNPLYKSTFFYVRFVHDNFCILWHPQFFCDFFFSCR